LRISKLIKTDEGVESLKRLMTKLDGDFDPPFHTRVDSLEAFISKMLDSGMINVASKDSEIAGAVGYYCNDSIKFQGYITYFGVLHDYHGRGIANRLLEACIKKNIEAGMHNIRVRTDKSNLGAIRFYRKNGFILEKPELETEDSNEKVYLVFEIGK